MEINMATWWNDLIQLWEMPDGNAAEKPRTSGIHYAVKQALDRKQLVDDIGIVLDRGVMQNRPPAGYTVGEMRPGSVGLTFNRDERENLHKQGINAIVVKNGTPYVWGQQFQATSGQVYSITDNCDYEAGLSHAFREFISLCAGFRPDPIFGHIGKRQPGDKHLAERFKLKRYLQLTEQQILENEEMWAAEMGATTLEVPLTVSNPIPPQAPAKVHPLHRALGAQARQIGMVTLGNRDL
jgi:hypothetical protein